MKIALIVIALLIMAGFLPLWPHDVKYGTVRVNAYKKIMLSRGTMRMDKAGEGIDAKTGISLMDFADVGNPLVMRFYSRDPFYSLTGISTEISKEKASEIASRKESFNVLFTSPDYPGVPANVLSVHFDKQSSVYQKFNPRQASVPVKVRELQYVYQYSEDAPDGVVSVRVEYPESDSPKYLGRTLIHLGRLTKEEWSTLKGTIGSAIPMTETLERHNQDY